jgi:hypothetical protein
MDIGRVVVQQKGEPSNVPESGEPEYSSSKLN